MPADTAQQLARLKTDFDDAFARPPPSLEAEREVLLKVRVGGAPLAMPLRQLEGLHRLPPVVSLPGSPSGLLGLAGLRGQLIAVHDLAALLALPRDAQPGWLLVCRGGQGLGLAAEAFEGQLRVEATQLQPHGAEEQPRPYVRASVRVDGAAPLPLLDVDSLVQALLDGGGAPQLSR